jgi:hypothetical protein
MPSRHGKNKKEVWLIYIAFSFIIIFSGLEIDAINSCERVYNMEGIQEACIRYNGGKSLGRCSIGFDNIDPRTEICIVPERIKLSCYSNVKYYKDFPHEFFTEV